MALITCPECGKSISDSAETCPHCGYPVQSLNRVKGNISENGSLPYPFKLPVKYLTLPAQKPVEGTTSTAAAEMPQHEAPPRKIRFPGGASSILFWLRPAPNLTE